MTIAFLSPAWPPGSAANGIVAYIDLLTAALERLGHKTVILSVRTTGTNLPPNVYPLPTPKPSPVKRIRDAVYYRVRPEAAVRSDFSRSLLTASQKAIAEQHVDLIELEETFGLVPLVKRYLRVPLVVRLHGPHFLNGSANGVPTNSAYYHRVRHEGQGISEADAISAPSHDVLERTRAHYGFTLPGAEVIRCPAPIVPTENRWRLADCDPNRLLFVGRFDRHKGGDVTVDALRIVAQRFPCVRLWIAGSANGFTDDAGQTWTLERYLAERAPDVAARVDALWKLPNASIVELRRQAFLTIVASRYENFPAAALEAMAHGCPLVATETGGIPEIVNHESNGLLARPADPAALAAAIIRLLDAPEFAAQLADRAAQDCARVYHPDAIARQTEAFYKRMLDRRTPS